MKRGLIVLSIGALGLVACGSPADPEAQQPAQQPSAEPSESQAADVLRVVCHADGATELIDNAVETSPDGVRIRVDNRADEFASLNGTGIDFSPGVTEEAAQVPPGELKIACWPGSMHGGPEPKLLPIQVYDSANLWQPRDLECADGTMMSNQINDYAGDSPGTEGDPVEIVRDRAEGLQEDDEIVSVGYPEAHYGRTVGIVREDALIVTVGFTPVETGGWLIGGISMCDGLGIRVGP